MIESRASATACALPNASSIDAFRSELADHLYHYGVGIIQHSFVDALLNQRSSYMTQQLPDKKTKIVCTIGPASKSQDVLAQLIAAGMNVARVNFSHGDLATHRETIANVRAAARAAGAQVAIFGDLPGPKMRLGEIQDGPVELRRGQAFTLHSDTIVGDSTRASHSFPKLPQVVKPGDAIFLNDGYIELEVERVVGQEVQCRVLVGGPLSSKKGINLPNTDLGINAFTERDHELLRFAAEQQLDGVSQSFVESAADIEAVRRAAADLAYHPFIIAKIERAGALPNLDAILQSGRRRSWWLAAIWASRFRSSRWRSLRSGLSSAPIASGSRSSRRPICSSR